jgi:hypothetical protein
VAIAEPVSPNGLIRIKCAATFTTAITSAIGKLIFTSETDMIKGEYPTREGKEKIAPADSKTITIASPENSAPKKAGINQVSIKEAKPIPKPQIIVIKGSTSSMYFLIPSFLLSIFILTN